jgi:peptidoglycan/LPS O-acetylase OafA/YrhL
MLAQASAPFFTQGHLGVHFFFILSGYLITTLLLREETREGQINLPAFYWRRALRILPVYLLVVSVAVAFEFGIKGSREHLDILPYYFVFLSNFIPGTDIPFLAPTWSLAVEEQYYLIWPVLLLFVPRRWIVPVLLGLLTVNVIAMLGLWSRLGARPITAGPLELTLALPTYTPILLGSLMGIVMHRAAGFRACYAVAGFRGAALLWMGVLLGVIATLPVQVTGAQNLIVHLLMCLSLASLVVREDNSLAPVLRWRPIARIGQISYGIYLYHLFALAVVYKGFLVLGWDAHLGWVMPIYFALSIGIAEISFRTYEAWFLRLKDRSPASEPDPTALPARSA